MRRISEKITRLLAKLMFLLCFFKLLKVCAFSIFSSVFFDNLISIVIELHFSNSSICRHHTHMVAFPVNIHLNDLEPFALLPAQRSLPRELHLPSHDGFQPQRPLYFRRKVLVGGT